MNEITKERLAAWITTQKMWDVIAKRRPENDTMGGLIAEVLQEVEEACEKGQLGIRIMEFERDPNES